MYPKIVGLDFSDLMSKLNIKNAALACVLVCFIASAIMAFYRYHNLAPTFKDFATQRVAVLDGERLKQEAKCFKSHEKVSVMLNELVSKIRDSEKQIKKSYDEVKNNQKLTLEMKNHELAKIESKWKSLSKKYNEEMQSIRNMDLKITDITQNKLFSILNSIAKSHKLNIILNKSSDNKLNVFYTAKNIDITDLVIQNLDKELPNINIEDLK